MATVFKRATSEVWIASYRVWNAKKGTWVWVQKSTGLLDRSEAAGVAATLERGAGEAKSGRMTRARALELVNDILKMTGVQTIESSPSLTALVTTMENERDVSEGTEKKYRAQWKSLREWAGDKAGLAVDAWTIQDCSDYYQAMKAKHSATTANDHLRFAGMVFGRAQALGYITSNPVEGVVKVGNDSVEKETFSRAETAKLLRVLRKNKQTAWVALSALGWHTGHRIQDLLDVTAADSLSSHPDLGWLVELRPAKKARQANARIVVLPIPTWLALMIRRIGDFCAIRSGDNTNGRVSGDFITWLKAAGVDPMPVKRKNRTIHLKSFHSNRHSMVTRLIGAGVSGELSRLVTDHASAKVQKRYVHSDVKALKKALIQARRQ